MLNVNHSTSLARESLMRFCAFTFIYTGICSNAVFVGFAIHLINNKLVHERTYRLSWTVPTFFLANKLNNYSFNIPYFIYFFNIYRLLFKKHVNIRIDSNRIGLKFVQLPCFNHSYNITCPKLKWISLLTSKVFNVALHISSKHTSFKTHIPFRRALL